MYPGHFAAGLAIKAAEPRAPTLALMIGVGLLDLVYGVLVMAGVEGGTLAHIDCTWSHSLLSAVVLSLLFAAPFRRAGGRVTAAVATAVFSHWLFDLLSHRPDIDPWPRSAVEWGLGPWFGGLGGWLEVAVTLGGCAAYVAAARRLRRPAARRLRSRGGDAGRRGAGGARARLSSERSGLYAVPS